MNKKTLVQYVLYLLVFVILFAFFNTYFSKKKIEPKSETKKVITSDQIKDILYAKSAKKIDDLRPVAAGNLFGAEAEAEVETEVETQPEEETND